MDYGDSTHPRQHTRFKLFMPTVMDAGRGPIRVHLLNLSASGALAHHASPPLPGERVRLDCLGVLRLATVMWSSGSRFGIAFTLPLGEAEVARVIGGNDAPVAEPAMRLRA
ncbi:MULTISPECIES: PilZ domain-containing protein [unclassified Sphingomonas]|uniref:PilZ domain-containing protein n=1 Tax=unclassified Sphingomonas TaxID=196159 RepID=UPI00226A05F6|nr:MULTISPECIES: PilZ domain-containing protein [unclassified Sphingomonas]